MNPLLLLVLACAPTPVPAAQATWTLDAVEAALPLALAGGLPDPWALRAAYLDALAAGDSSCPGADDDLAPPEVSLEGCTASSGWGYAGVSTFEDRSTAEQPDFRMLNGDFVLTDPQGQRFEVGGTFGFMGGQLPEGLWWQAEVQGSFVYPAARGWLQSGGGALLTLSGEQGPNMSRVTLEGAVHGDSAQLYVPGLEFGACEGATGALHLRNPEGVWAELSLDCGCGSVQEQGLDLGELCPDLSELEQAVLEIGAW